MIELPQAVAEEIVRHAFATAPREACGLLAGSGRVPMRAFAIRNAEPGVSRFRFDPREQRRALGEVADRGLRVVGFFHSHPRTPPVPSPADTAAAHRRDTATGRTVVAHPDACHVIVSLRNEPAELRAFRFDGGRAIEERIVVR